MLQINDFQISPADTRGIVHVENLTQESARETTELLRENNARYHIFTTTEDDKGVRRVIRSVEVALLTISLRYTYTTTLSIIH